MMPLTNQQLEQYKLEGYAKGGQILAGPELARLRSEIDREIAALPPGRRPENMPSLHYQNSYLRDLFLSTPLVDVAEQILGPDVALFVTYVISKRPVDGLAVEWHQDAAFFPIDPMHTFTLWLAVDDSDWENGCMRVIPGSHRNRVLWSHEIKSGSTLPLTLQGLDVAKAVDVELKAGEFSVHDPFLVRGSDPSHSIRRRCGITIKYIPTYVEINRSYVSPTGFDWGSVRIYLARGNPGKDNQYVNVQRSPQAS